MDYNVTIEKMVKILKSCKVGSGICSSDCPLYHFAEHERCDEFMMMAANTLQTQNKIIKALSNADEIAEIAPSTKVWCNYCVHFDKDGNCDTKCIPYSDAWAFEFDDGKTWVKIEEEDTD